MHLTENMKGSNIGLIQTINGLIKTSKQDRLVFPKKLSQNNIEGQSNTKFPKKSVPIGTSKNKQYPKYISQYPVIKYPQYNKNSYCFSGLESDPYAT